MNGDDELQIKIIVTSLVISLMITALVPIVVPDWNEADGVGDAQTLATARSQMTRYTGESMLTMSPWVLHDVRTPYSANAQTSTHTNWGWVYGSIEQTYTYNGTNYIGQSIIRMDPAQTSDERLTVAQASYIALDNQNEGLFGGIINWWNELWGNTKTYQGQQFNFTGLMYNFYPTAEVNTSGSWNTAEQGDSASLNIVWYKTGYGSGISSGLILYSDRQHAVIRDYSSTDIITGVSDNDLATKYYLNYEGVNTYMYIQFDPDVIAQGESLQKAWDNGRWTIAFASPTADNLINRGTGSASLNLGQIVDTYKTIATFEMPQEVPGEWQTVLWIVCVIPLLLAMLLVFIRILGYITNAIAGVIP